MQALKALVIIMGILIIVGFAVLIAAIANRLSGSAAEDAAPAAFGEASLPVPDGCRVTAAVPAVGAAQERLILQLGGDGDCNQVLIVDMRTGALLGRLLMAPGAAATP